MGLLYRCFHAIRGLSTRDGQPTNAVFGVVRKMTALERAWTPTHWGVVFDGGLPQERLDLIPAYKAQRPHMPEGLRSQLPLVERYLDAAAIARIRLEGEEADDVMASVAQWAVADGAAVFLVSNDKDLYQLVSDDIRMIPPAGDDTALDASAVREKTGVPPERIVEWLALVGDASDNIDGVPGVGAKTAARLLNEYGSLQELRAALPGLPDGKLKRALVAEWPRIERNVQAVRLNAGLETGWTWTDLERGAVDEQAVLRLFDELEFHKLAQAMREPELL